MFFDRYEIHIQAFVDFKNIYPKFHNKRETKTWSQGHAYSEKKRFFLVPYWHK